MSIRAGSDGTILLEGACSSEDAEPLLQLLLATPGAAVDWHLCSAAHSAIVQVLLVAKPELRGTPRSIELTRWVKPALAHLAQVIDLCPSANITDGNSGARS